MPLPIPMSLVYVGLTGTLLALVVATANNGWKPRVLFLLALRLAIGWHFLFEGLYKVNSYYVGQTETNRPFSSEPYFAAAEGPFGDYVRKKYLGDPAAKNAARLTPKKEISQEEFLKLPEAEQAALCPDGPAKELEDAILKAADKPKEGEAPEEAEARKAAAPARAAEAKAIFAKWVYGASTRPGKVSFIASGDVDLSAPARRELIELKRSQVEAVAAQDAQKMGTGYGIEAKRASAGRADLRAAEADLAADTDKFLAEIAKLEGGAAPPRKALADTDFMTMWVLTAFGACLLAGFMTKPAAVGAAGFLALTYLTHPPFPWYPLPPNTEGNPLFVNKNVIEALALLVIVSFPTGRWLGVDSLLYWAAFGRNGKLKPAV